MKSTYSFPSTSQTRLPRPRSRKSGEMPTGKAVRDFENVCDASGMTASARARNSVDLRYRSRGSCSAMVLSVGREVRVDGGDLGMLAQQLVHIIGAERRIPHVERLEDPSDERKILGIVDRPAQITSVLAV